MNRFPRPRRIGPLIACMAAISSAAVLDTIFISDFQTTQSWTALPGMTLSVSDITGRSKALHIKGLQASAWNYAQSPSFALQPGRIYRLTAWIMVDSINPANRMPYLKLEYAGISGRSSTTVYDQWYMGWQQLVLEFTCPAGVTGGNLAVEKGVNTQVYADIYLDDVLLTEQNRPSDHIYHFDTVPSALYAAKGAHPRLYLTPQSLTALRGKMTSQPYATMLGHLRTLADRWATNGPPVYTAGADAEQLWQRDVGNAIPHLVMAYLMTGTGTYLNAAKAYMLAAASYPTWGLGPYDNHDLATGHQLYGMALGYDWLFADLDAPSRDSIRNCLVRRGGRLFDLLLADSVYWADEYLQNHQWVNMTGLATAGLALYGGADDVDGWIVLPLTKFRRAMASLQPDGAGHEGIPYWEYGIEYLMKFMQLGRDLLGEEFFAGSPFFQNTAAFRLYAMVPMDYWRVSNSRLMTTGDNPRYDWYGPDYLLRKLAAEYHDANAQWLADKLDSAGYCSPGADFLNLLWVDPAIAAQSPATLPAYKHFNDLDVVYLRSGWSGGEALTQFKCGPFIGHYATSRYGYDPGGGHVHPDEGMFQIFAHGDWLVTDEGYAFKRTIFQNTLVVNGKGQIGEGGPWFNGTLFCGAPDQPTIVYTKFGPDCDYVIGNAAPAYAPSTHLTSFRRHLLYVKPDCWVVGDEVTADSASLYEFYFHSDFAFAADSGNRFGAAGTRGALRMTILRPADAASQTFLQDIEATGGGVAARLNVLKVSSSGKTRDLFISVLEALDVGQSPRVRPWIAASAGGDTLVLAMADTIRRFRILSDRPDRNAPLFVDVNQSNSILERAPGHEGVARIAARTDAGRVRIVIPAPDGWCSLEVIDMRGRIVWRRESAETAQRARMVTLSLARGWYTIRLKQGRNQVMKKFVF